ncbi:MAG TPA: hypothetical protein VHV30_00800 [Polyangiaceae bacterium]|jgi:hypothetical protein|nr:hypothetical protein [Polyangiaceae bacterium]
MKKVDGFCARSVWRRVSMMLVLGGLAVPWAGANVGCGGAPAPDLKGPTNADAFDTTKCVNGQPSSTPDLMAWDSVSRLNLSRLRNQGIVAVRYQAHGCEVQMELLSNCIAKGSYEFTPYVSNEHKIAHDQSELYAQLPLGAASLSGKVAGDRSLRTDYSLVGEHALPPDATYKLSDFQGADCPRATHVISAVYVGGFALVSGNEREIDAAVTVFGAGGGAGQTASVERLANEGDPEACERAQKEHTADDSCNVPLRVGLLPISDVIVAPAPTPSPDGFDGGAATASGTGSNPSPPSRPGGVLGALFNIQPVVGAPGTPGSTGVLPQGGPGALAAAPGSGVSPGPSNAASGGPAAPIGQKPSTTESVNTPIRPATTNPPPPPPHTPFAPVHPQQPPAAAPATRPTFFHPEPQHPVTQAPVRATGPTRPPPAPVCARGTMNCRGRCLPANECH